MNEDVERGPSTVEHVVLSIAGMKCGCCESGLAKALQKFPAISNHNINLVLARVEFDLDTSKFTSTEITVKLKDATGYTFEVVEAEDGKQVLEILVNDPVALSAVSKPVGVLHVETQSRKLRMRHMVDRPAPSSQAPSAIRRHMVRVHYDASRIGPRSLFEYYKYLLPQDNVELAPPSADPSLAVGSRQTRHALYLFLATMICTVPVLVLTWVPFRGSNKMLRESVSLSLATIVQCLAILEFAPSTFKTLLHTGQFEMDSLILVSTGTAYIFSVMSFAFLVKGQPLPTGSFFETSTLLVTLIFLGRVVNEFARLRATKSISFRSLQIQEALLELQGLQPIKIDARLLQRYDRFRVPPHTKIVTDGNVVHGGSEVDESVISGESVPVAKGLGHKVFAGATNGSGQLIVEATATMHENSISRIANLVEEAGLSKPRIQALADGIAGLFFPTIITICLTVFLIWIVVGLYVRHQNIGEALAQSLTYAVATLVVSCPCAIGLAVPMVILIAGGVSARHGIVFRDPQKLEIARNTKHVVFDKTGTLTKGELSVIREDHPGGKGPEVLVQGLLLGLLSNISHPVSVAIVKHLRGKGIPVKPVDNIQSLPGKGAQGTYEGESIIRAGSQYWLAQDILESKYTTLCVTLNSVLCATFYLSDSLRSTSEPAVSLLSKRGITVHILSGDNKGSVQNTAHLLNIPRTQALARCSPADKRNYIRTLQKDGSIVVFVGDGTNDSPALKQADIGVHVSSSNACDVARGAADVVLTSPNLTGISIMLDISKAAYRRIIFNFVWSALYNVVAIAMAAGAFVKIRIEPMYAGLGEVVSVVPVVLVAFGLVWVRFGERRGRRRWKKSVRHQYNQQSRDQEGSMVVLQAL